MDFSKLIQQRLAGKEGMTRQESDAEQHVEVNIPLGGMQSFTVVPDLDPQTHAVYNERMKVAVGKMIEDGVLPDMALRALTEVSTYADFGIFKREINYLADSVQQIAMLAHEKHQRDPDADLADFLRGNIRDLERLDSNFAIALSAMMRLDDTMKEIQGDHWAADERPIWQMVNEMNHADERNWREALEWVKKAPRKDSQEWQDAVTKAHDITMRLIKAMGLDKKIMEDGLTLDAPTAQTSIDQVRTVPRLGNSLSDGNPS